MLMPIIRCCRIAGEVTGRPVIHIRIAFGIAVERLGQRVTLQRVGCNRSVKGVKHLEYANAGWIVGRIGHAPALRGNIIVLPRSGLFSSVWRVRFSDQQVFSPPY